MVFYVRHRSMLTTLRTDMETRSKKRKMDDRQPESIDTVPSYDVIKTNSRKYEDKCSLFLIGTRLMDEFADLIDHLTHSRVLDYYEDETLAVSREFHASMKEREPFASYAKRREELIRISKKKDDDTDSSSEDSDEDLESLDTYVDYWFVLLHHWIDTGKITTLDFEGNALNLTLTIRRCKNLSFVY